MNMFSSARHRRAVRRATARLRGAALAVAVFAVGVREQTLAAMDTTSAPGTLELSHANARYATLQDRRSTLTEAHQLLHELEQRGVTYPGRQPRHAPASGWELATVQVARARLDEAHDSLLSALETAHESISRLGGHTPDGR